MPLNKRPGAKLENPIPASAKPHRGAELENSLATVVAGGVTGILGVLHGGTGSSTAAGARTNLGVEAQDATLDALAAYNTNGILTQTAADTFTGRTITGTAAEITATNGSGVAGNPTLSLPAALTFTGKTVTGGTFSSPTLSGTITTSFTAGSVIFAGTSGVLSENNTKLFWDDSTSRLGIGTGTPAVVLDVVKTVSGTTTARVTNATNGAAAAARFELDNDTPSVFRATLTSSGFTPAGVNRAGGGRLECDGAGGITINTLANQPIYFAVNSTQVAQVDANRMSLSKPLKPPSYTVAGLPTPVAGDEAYVTDSTVAIAAGLGLAPVGGGANGVPVFCDNTPAWKIG